MRRAGEEPLQAPALTPAIPAGATWPNYVDDLRATSVRLVPGSGHTCWAASGSAVRRLPTFEVRAPDRDEVDGALRATGAVVASYIMEPDVHHPANASVYLCSRRDYALRMLDPAMQRNVRRALRELTIGPLSPVDLLAHGSDAFCDTRRRNGLDDGTVARFRQNFAHHGRLQRAGRTYLGAWRNGRLAAFLMVLHVDDWVELDCFSTTAMREYRPNDGLLYVALSRYLGEEKCRLVSFGLSTIQVMGNAAGLDRFKRKVGFSARPVHRAFAFHPSVRPFVRRSTMAAAHWTVARALRFRPGNRRLRKLGGMLAMMRENDGGYAVMHQSI